MSAQIWEFLGSPLPLPRPVQIWLTTPSPPVRADTRLALSETLQLVNMSHRSKQFILILDVHTCVFLLDNFDNSIQKDGVDHEVNVKHRHDWPKKKMQVFQNLGKFHKYGSHNFFSKWKPTFG